MAPVTQVPTPQTVHYNSHQQADSMDIDNQTAPTEGEFPIEEDTQGEYSGEPPTTPIQGGEQSSPQPQEQDFQRAKAPERPQASERREQFMQERRPAKKSSHELIAELWRRLEQKDEEMLELRKAQINATTSSIDSRLVDQLSRLFERSDGQSMLEREERRLTQLAQTHWRDTKKLHGRDNYSDWRKGILLDADYLDARDILLRPDSVPKETSLQRTRLDTSRRLLYTRILDRLTPDIAYQVQTDHTQPPSDILSKLDTIYGISPAEKRLLLVKTLLNLKPQGDYIAMMRQWQRVSAELERQEYSISEICHDIGIVLLGEYQRSFIRTQLDHLFMLSKKNQLHEMDMAAIIDQLESRTPSAPGHYKPLSYTIYRQEPWGHIPQPDNLPSKGGNKKSQPITGASSDPSSPQKPSNNQSKTSKLCPHCKRGYHKIERCWVLHPELRPPKEKENPPSNDTSPNGNNQSKPITGTTGVANLVHSTRRSDDWIFDTGATWTIHSDKAAFASYMPLSVASSVELPNGSTHCVEGIGSIYLPIGEHMVELKNTRHVPTLHTRLLSFNQLEDQGFHIKLTDDKPYRFRITTPDKSSSFLISRTTAGGMFDSLESEKGVINVVNDANDRLENKARNLTPNRPPPASIETWHHRLSHMNQHDLQYLHRVGRINIQGKKLLPTCDFCRRAKTTRCSGNGPTPRATCPGRRLHVDIFGGGQTLGLPSDDDLPPANGKYKYVMILTDDATRMRWTIPLENRVNPNHHIRTHMDFLRRLGYETAYLRGDGEFFKNPREWAGIKIESSAPYSPWQNGVSERGIRIILGRTRAVLYASGLPRRFWLEALMDTTQKANYLPTSTPLFNDPTPDGNILNENIKKSPFYIPAEAWENRPMDISYYRPFGAKIWYHRHGTEKPTDKMDTRGTYGLLLANLSSTNQLVWNIDKDSMIHITNGKVDEGDISLTDPTFTPQPTLLASSTNEKTPPTEPYSDDNPPNDDIMIRPAKGFIAYVTGATSRDIPRTLRRAMERKDKNKWLKAMQREFSKLQSKEIFELVRISDVPKGKRIFPGKWVYDSKEDYPPDDERSYKARWVILGNLVEKDDMQYDYCKYAPVVSAAITRLLFALAAAFGWKLRKLDVAVAFLNGDLIDEIYMRQPYGFEQGEGLVWRLKKSIYGLTPAARIWYDTLTAALHRLGFRTCSYDPGLFIHQERRHLYITTHVDDFQLVAEHDEDIEWAKDVLAKEWEIKDVSDMTYYLGMEVEFVNGHINLLQREFIKDLVQSFGLDNANHQTTPLPQGFEVDDEPDRSIITREYQRGTGKLQWLAVKTRPDISEAAGTLARFNTAPTKKCWNGLLHVMRYLKGTMNVGLTYGPASTSSITNCLPIGYSDSNWAGPNSGRKSIGGYIFLYEGSPISWQSKRQTCVATSSNEAEYMAISEASKEALWLRRVCIEMNVATPESPPILLHTDSEGAQALASTEGTKRSKHIDVRYHHIRELQSLALVNVEGIRSQDNPADGLTKIQSTPKHRHFLHLINMDRIHLHPTSDGE